MSSSAISTRSILYLGFDVHKESVTVAVLPEGATAPTRLERLPNDFAKLRRFMDRLAEQGEFRACYEASGAGYVLHRAMREWGYQCEVIAPSLIPTKPGVQRKHDKHDAAQLARLYREGTNWSRPHIRWLQQLAGGVSSLASEDLLVYREYLALFEYKL